MPTSKPRAIITASEDLMDAINHYQNVNHIGSQSKAIIDLISQGIMQAQQDEEVKNLVLSADEVALLLDYRKSSPEACSRVRSILAVSADEYKKPDLNSLAKSPFNHVVLLQLFDECPYATQSNVMNILRNSVAMKMSDPGGGASGDE